MPSTRYGGFAMTTLDKKINKLFLGTELNYYELNEEAETITLFLTSVIEKEKCPCCGIESSSVHSWYVKKFTDLSLEDKYTNCVLKNKIFVCRNKECSEKGKHFGANYPFMDLLDKKTKRLIDRIFSEISLNTVRGAAEILKKGHIKADVREISRLKLAKGMRKSDIQE